MSSFEGKVAVVTGAGSGIGRSLAVRLAGHGARLALCDTDAEALAETAGLVETAGTEAYRETVDVSDRAAVTAYARGVRSHFGEVHQVYNNAGIGHIGPITDVEYDDIRRVMDVNFWGVVHGTKEFLPHLIESGDGHVVNVSSVFGIVAAPWLSGYDAAKFAVRGFTEALRGELLAAKHPVRVTCVHPGGVRTPFVEHSEAAPGEDLAAVERYFRRITVTTPDGAARAILRGVRLNRARLLIGPDARLADAGQRIFGSQYERVAGLTARWFVPSANK